MCLISEAESLPWRPDEHGVTLKLRVTPKGGRDAIDGIVHLGDGQAVLKLRVRAAPEDGEANKAVIATLAKALGLPKSRISLDHGAASRIKTVFLQAAPGELEARLATLLAGIAAAAKE